MIAAGLLSAAILVGLTLVIRVAAYRHDRSAASRRLLGALLFMAIALFVRTPPIYTWLDRTAFHHDNTSTLFAQVALVVACTFAVAMIVEIVKAQRWMTLVVSVTAAVTALVMAVDFLTQQSQPEFADYARRYGMSNGLVPYWAFLLAFCTTALLVVATLTLRARISRAVWLRRGLRLIGAGALMCAVFLMYWAMLLIAELRHWSVPAWLTTTSVAWLTVGIVTLAVGTLLPTLGPRLRLLLAARRIRPLWREVTASYPEVRTLGHRRPSALRMIVEIRDATSEAHRRGQAHRSPVVVELLELPSRALVDLDDEIDAFEQLARSRRHSREVVA